MKKTSAIPWSAEAEAAIKKVPFFVRKRIRARVEKEAGAIGKSTVGMAEVEATRRRYLYRMASEVKGYQIDACFGPSGCPNRANQGEQLLASIEQVLREADLLAFLRQEVGEHLKFHHEFRVTLADCPNACSQPQIKDIGIIGACLPRVSEVECSQCEACIAACREEAVTLSAQGPLIDQARCLACGQCLPVCPTGTLAEDHRGFKVMLGGKLGRHPRLAQTLPGLYDEQQVLAIVRACLHYYKRHSRKGRRFAELITPQAIEQIAKRHGI